MAQNSSSGCRDDDDWHIPEQPESINTLFTLAERSYAIKDYDEALGWYGLILERAEETDNEHTFIKSLCMISRCHLEKGNYDEANSFVVTVFNLVVSKCPENIHIPVRLIVEIKERRGDIIDAFISAILFNHLHSTNESCRVTLANIQEKVEESLKQSGTINTIFSELLNKGKQFYKNKEYSAASAFFEKAIEVFHFLPDENLQQAYIWKTKCLFMIGDYDQAETMIVKVLVRYPENPTARKLHKKIVEAKKVKTDKENLSHPPPESKHKQQQQPKSTEVPKKAQKAKKTGKDTKVANDFKADVTRANDHQDKKSKGNSSTWEGLPGPTTTKTQKPFQNINQPSMTSPSKSTSGHGRPLLAASFATSSSPAAKQPDGIPTEDETNATGSVTPDKSIKDKESTESNDEAPFQVVQRKKTRAKSKVVEKKSFSLPKGVEVICEHFEKKVFAHPQKSSTIPKVCQSCQESKLKCKYAYWSEQLKQWKSVRSFPSNVRDTVKQIRSCHHFQNGKKCYVTCRFAHGPELQMWELERKGDLPSPEMYLKNKKMPPGDAATPNPPNTAASNYVVQGARGQPTLEPSTVRRTTSCQKTHGTQYQPQRAQSLSSAESNNACPLPEGVAIVCNDFMWRFKSIKVGVHKKNVCKSCGEKCKELQGNKLVSYAFWNKEVQQWFLVRPYPKRLVRVAFRRCRSQCSKPNCTFAHGPELAMWTMEREGTLIPPWRALFLQIVPNDNRHVAAERPLPLGTRKQDLRLCKSVESRIICRFGRGCHFPHSKRELDAWSKSYQQRLEELKETQDTNRYLKHCELELTDSYPGVELSCHPGDPNVKLAEDCNDHTYTWEFCARSEVKVGIPVAVELQYFHEHFHFTKLHVVGFDETNKQTTVLKEVMKSWVIKQPKVRLDSKIQRIEFRLTVSFQASVFGSFAQRILFSFGCQPFLKKEFNIDVCSKETLDRLEVIRQSVNLQARPWEDQTIKRNSPPDSETQKLMVNYSLPKDAERIVSAQMVQGEIREDTYKQTMHQLLFAEEAHMKNLLLSLTPTNVKLKAVKSKPISGIGGTEYAKEGHLFGCIKLDNEITPDDMAGRVCLRNVQFIWIKPCNKPQSIYELSSEIYEGNTIFVDLKPKVCKDLKIMEDSVVDVEMRFNLNRNILCIMHKAVDSLGKTQARQLFPVEQLIRRRKSTVPLEWILDPRLNECQKRVIQEIAEVVPPSPPLVVFGPFGTGKTLTLNQAVIYLMKEKANRVLLCTHTNSAADIHLELLDEYLCRGNRLTMHAATPLRVHQPEMELKKTTAVAQKYGLIKDGIFLMPTRKDIINHRVVITTLTTADVLTKLKFHHGFFTHILIDEAAQAWETEALIPLALAGPNTKIVFTGDHMQMSPEVYSKFALKWGLKTSLPERLFDHYESKDNKDEQVFFLFENYRSHEEILKFPSEYCYDGRIEAKGNVPRHPELSPLIFYSAKGKDEKQSNNSYLNSSEVDEVGRRVAELIEKWPPCWGEKNLREIAVVAPYKYQVDAIRGVLRRRRLSEVNVQTVHNVQGREYRALFISTVRTWHSISENTSDQADISSCDEFSLEFFSDPKLLVTAVTRAKSMVAVVGDPFALCTLGGCRDLWKNYIYRCHYLKGLNGTSWEALSQEIKDHFASAQLNPEAPVFVPQSQTPAEDGEEQNLDAANRTEIDNDEAAPSVNTTPSDDLVEESEDGEDQASSCSGDVQETATEDDEDDRCIEDDLADETVLQVHFDKIIEALRKFIHNHQQETALFDEEFPALTKNPLKVKDALIWPSTEKPVKSFNVGSLGSDYEMFTINGHTKVQLVDIYRRPSERVQQIFMNNYKQQNLEPEVLVHLLESDPSRYQSGQLQIRNEKSRPAYLVIPDKNKTDIQVKGSIRHAFDLDTVVVEAQQSQKNEENRGFGFLVGVLDHIISPRERQYVCKVDLKNPSLMIPINRSVTSIVNLSHDKTFKDIIPIYKKRKILNERLGEPIKILTTKEVIEKKLLFVVEFLQWRSDCSRPLGIAVSTISTGETIEKCQKILFAECGIRKTFGRSVKAMIQQSFPPKWEIPKNAIEGRLIIKNAFTIDPPESEDLDDAISVEDTGGETFKVGIHIADVSFFVKRGSDLDQEAQKRGVTYYPGKEGEENIPMLPRELSENVLSLLPKKDRLTVSVFVTLDNEGNVVGDCKILRTVTRSRCRLSYSEAQDIIDEKDCQARDDIPDEVREGIQLLHPLAVKRRRQRLKEASLDHSDNREDSDAHELIEELMILANHTVGNFLHHKNTSVTPFRTQLEPKVHRLNEWATDYGSLAKYFPALQPQLENEDILAEIREKINLEEREIDIQVHAWDQICEAATSGDHKKVERIICDPLSSPQLAIARGHLRKIQNKSQYTCSKSDTKHHSLELSNYVHFTSPIRRYMDVEVHRLLLTLIPRNGPIEQPLYEDNMKTFCRRSTYFNDNSKKFEKEFKRIHFASTLQKQNQTGVFFIDQLENRFFTIQPTCDREDHFLSKHKKIKFDLLAPHSKSDVEGKPETTLKWKLRIYIAHSSTNEESYPARLMDAERINNMLSARSKNNVNVQTIDGATWTAMIDAIKESRTDDLLQRVKDTGEKLKRKTVQKRTTNFQSTSRDVYTHPNSGRKDDSANSNSDGHFHEITINLKQFDIVGFQMFSHLHSGMLCPDVQLFTLSSDISICLEHRRYPHRSFALDTKQCASIGKYDSIDEYIQFWKPVLAMEAAYAAVEANDGFILKSLAVKWSQKGETIMGEFTLANTYCESRQIQFHYGDLACVKIPFPENLHSQDPVTSEPTAASKESVKWIGHCIVKTTENKEENPNRVCVAVRIHQMACEFPQELLSPIPIECNMDIIYQPLPLRRMNVALNCKLQNSSDLVQAICRGESPAEETFPVPRENLSLANNYKTSGFQPLNKYQEEAVKQAVSKPFSLIQGPPGTGKTVTGVHIAYWFAKQNRMLKPEVNPKDTAKSKTDADKLAPPQVLYCGPSNKSVDVVTEYLLRIPGVKDKILRVHGTLIEEAEFPIPNKIRISKPTVSEDELKIPGEKVREVSLHHFIRSESSPYSQILREFEEQFALAKERSERPNDKDVAKYCETIQKAEFWAIQKTGKEIILCTCSRSGSRTIISACDNIQQCIIDECGMCMEPEVLVPMTSSKAKQFVLIGDHKQLQPIVMDRLAKTFGLDISMFQRLSQRAFMLKIQYRMHPSICQFPSQKFYNENLETSPDVLIRPTAEVNIWPQNNFKFAFCHVEGEEKASVISTADSGVSSKCNMEEAKKAVQVAKYLVDNHAKITKNDVVILTPYRQQRKVIQDLLGDEYQDILVTTVIKSQGSEWDYVILSLVRSLPEKELEPDPPVPWYGEHLGFITDDHQINVALTRAKDGLCIIGNKNLLAYSSTWNELINDYQKKDCVVEGYQWPVPVF